MDLRRCAHSHGGRVGPEHDVGMEHGEQRVEVAVARGGQEGVDDFPLAGAIRAGSRGRTLHPAARAARELPGRARGASQDRRDLVEGQVEHVVQHEGHPLGRRQRVEDHEERETDRVG